MMSPTSDKQNDQKKQRFFNITLAAVAGQVGCLTLVIVLAAVFLGLWLDNNFQTKPLYTLILVVLSIPISLITMFFVTRITINKIKFRQERQEAGMRKLLEEETDLGRDEEDA